MENHERRDGKKNTKPDNLIRKENKKVFKKRNNKWCNYKV